MNLLYCEIKGMSKHTCVKTNNGYIMRDCITVIFITALCVSSCKNSTDYEHDPMMDKYTWVSKVHLVNADGTNDHILPITGGLVHYANFLPNGQKILIVQDGGIVSLINPDGTQKQQITTGRYIFQYLYNSYAQRLLVTQDSRRIIYSTAYEPSYALNIYAMNLDGTGELNLTQNPLELNHAPVHVIRGFAISHDDKTVVYADCWLDSSHTNTLCIVNTDGSNKRIVKDFGFKQPLCAQFLPTDNSTIVFLEEDYWNGMALNRISLSDTTVVQLIARTTISYAQYPPISPAIKMYVPGDAALSLQSIDLMTGEKHEVPTGLPYGSSWISLSKDGLRLLSADYVANYSVSNIDGSALRTFVFPQPSSAKKRDVFLSPSGTQIIYRTLDLAVEH